MGISLSAALLAACTSHPEVSVPARGGDPACARLPWPEQVSGHAQVTTSSPSPAVRAWGDPALIARCGFDEPAAGAQECLSVDGVDWLVRPLDGGVAFTAFGRSPTIEVLVPAAYHPEPLLLPVFGAVARALPSTGKHCS